MRIDEFSNTAGIDGSMSTTEITRFMLVGFDLAPDELTLFSGKVSVTFTITKPDIDFTITKPDAIFTIT